MTRMRSAKVTEYLLVEGVNDEHVIKNLCFVHGVAAPFIEDVEGIEELFAGITNRLKEENIRTLGIVVDADVSPSNQWERVTNRLAAIGYGSIPAQPPHEGWVSTESVPMRVGVWIMPDNGQPGMLEDFVAQLIPVDDPLLAKAGATLQEVEREGIHRYNVTHRPKALIHTWLAWQAVPGMPMGRAITIGALDRGAPVALLFIGWLQRLFDPTGITPEVA